MQVHVAEHLQRHERIRLGSYYTPEKLVRKVYEFIRPYLIKHQDNSVIFDSAGGCGAFLAGINGCDYRVADRDNEACEFLRQSYDSGKIFYTNSLIGVSRKKYSIGPDAFLIMIGNPPYNDVTSEFKSGEKGENLCDEDLFDRDMGISFLKSYNKLRADVVCVLHPLSYLIKEANFKRLRDFRDNYKLVRGEVFSSALFSGTGYGKFPIVIALYARSKEGMTFEYIRNFKFNVLDYNNSFVLSGYNTTDGYINKYPPRRNEIRESPIGLYYYTFRDINSLKKNTTFFTKKHPNGIVVTLENFYEYSYLYSFKKLFNPENAWLYGNLSPLIDSKDLEHSKKLYVSYAIKTNNLFEKRVELVKKIKEYYKIGLEDLRDISNIENRIKDNLNRLIT